MSRSILTFTLPFVLNCLTTDSPFTLGLAAHLLQDKGVETLVRAQEILSERGLQIRVLLAGARNASNPALTPEETLARWRGREDPLLLGNVDDISAVWAHAHVAVLPSTGEGLPKSLLEPAACCRPLIVIDVPDCREIMRPDVTDLLVPPDNPAALANAIERLMKDRALRLRLDAAARQTAVAEFSSASVGAQIVRLYTRMLADSHDPRLVANETT